jgi:hypothetical protein
MPANRSALARRCLTGFPRPSGPDRSPCCSPTPATVTSSCSTCTHAAVHLHRLALRRGPDQEHVGAQVAHEDVTTTNRINRIYRYVLRRRQRGEIGRRRQLAMHESAAEVAPEGMATRARIRCSPSAARRLSAFTLGRRRELGAAHDALKGRKRPTSPLKLSRASVTRNRKSPICRHFSDGETRT